MTPVQKIEVLQNLYEQTYKNFGPNGSFRAGPDDKDLMEVLPWAVEELKKNLKRSELRELDPEAEKRFSKEINDQVSKVTGAIREATTSSLFGVQGTGVANSLRFIASMVERGLLRSFSNIRWDGGDVLEADLGYRVVASAAGPDLIFPNEEEDVRKAPEEEQDDPDARFFTYTSKEGNEYAVRICDCHCSDVEVAWKPALEKKVVQCQSCGKETYGYDGEPEAIAAWNAGDAW